MIAEVLQRALFMDDYESLKIETLAKITDKSIAL